MDNIRDYETENLCQSLDGDNIELTEELWYEQFQVTSRGPFSFDSELHRLLKGAYQKIKLLEREKRSFIYLCETSGKSN